MVEVLYKYMTSERVLTCLPEVGNGTLRATQPAALNDPFECAVVTDFIDIGWDQIRRDLEFAKALNSIPDTTEVSPNEVAWAKEQYGSLYLRDLFTRQLSQRFGIVSLSEEPRHLLMWSHYTSDGSGFVVGYSVERLLNLANLEAVLRPVQYREEVALIENYDALDFYEGHLHDLMSQKSHHWSYEKEWRLIVELDQAIGTGLRDSRGLPVNLVRIPNAAVVSVYHTERTPADVVEEVRSRLENPNNRYGVQRLTKLVASAERYGYQDAPEQGA